jgi:hypothetical protein
VTWTMKLFENQIKKESPHLYMRCCYKSFPISRISKTFSFMDSC